MIARELERRGRGGAGGGPLPQRGGRGDGARLRAGGRRAAGRGTVVLSGGVFQNRRLLERTSALLEEAGLRVLVPERMPPNDGGHRLRAAGGGSRAAGGRGVRCSGLTTGSRSWPSGDALALALLVALLLGLRHATDPDHLAAVTTLIASDPEDGTRRARTARSGLGARARADARAVRPAGGAVRGVAAGRPAARSRGCSSA